MYDVERLTIREGWVIKNHRRTAVQNRKVHCQLVMLPPMVLYADKPGDKNSTRVIHITSKFEAKQNGRKLYLVGPDKERVLSLTFEASDPENDIGEWLEDLQSIVHASASDDFPDISEFRALEAHMERFDQAAVENNETLMREAYDAVVHKLQSVTESYGCIKHFRRVTDRYSAWVDCVLPLVQSAGLAE